MFKKFAVVMLTLVIIIGAGYLVMRKGDVPYATLENAYANADSKFARVQNDTKLHYRDVGPRDAPILVLIHGFSASLHTWEMWADELAQDYRVISLDLPGHGLTRCPDIDAMGTAHFVETVDTFLSGLGVEQATFVGSSMGGNTSWNYALTHPDKVEGLVLVGASGWPSTEEEDESDPLVFKLLRYPAARAIMKDLDMSSLIRDGLENSFIDKTFVDDAMVARYTALGRAPCHRQAILNLMSNRAGAEDGAATAEKMARITAPTLVLHGEGDNVVPVSHGRKFAETLPNVQLVTYQAGHLPQEEVAAESLADLTAFLREEVYIDAAGVVPEEDAPSE